MLSNVSASTIDRILTKPRGSGLGLGAISTKNDLQRRKKNPKLRSLSLSLSGGGGGGGAISQPQQQSRHVSTSPMRTQAVKILSREELHNKRSRIQSLLIQQYSKFCGKNEALREELRCLVVDFVEGQSDLRFSDSQIAAFEKQVHAMLAQAKQQQTSKGQGKTAGTAARSESGVLSVQSLAPLESSKKTSGEADGVINHPDWTVLNAILSIKEEEQEQVSRRAAAQRKQQFRRALDAQVEHQRRAEEDARQRKQEQHELAMLDKQAFEQQQARAAQDRVRRHHQERDMNEEQMGWVRRRREEERALKIREEQGQAERNRLLAEEEERLRQARKEASRRAMERLIVENETNKALRAAQRRADGEYEAKLSREYAERMDREERARQEAFNSRIEALQRSSARFESTAGVAIKARTEKESARTQAAVEHELRERERREREEQEQRRRENARSAAFNMSLIEHKRSQQQQESEDRARTRRVDEAAAAAVRAAEKRKLTEKQRRMTTFREQLDEQRRFKEKQLRAEKVLSATETQINRSIVGSVLDNPELLSKVLSKVHAPVVQSPAAMVGFKFA